MSRAPVSITLGHRARPNPRLVHGGAFDDEDDEPPARAAPPPRRERERAREAPPRVIPLRSNDWREDRKRRLGILERHAPALGSLERGSSAAPETAFAEPQQSGLHMKQRAAPAAAEGDKTPPIDAAGESPRLEGADASDAEAIQSLLAESSGQRASRRVIVPSEEAGFRSDVGTRPDAPGLDAYASMPIEEFGAAMLRGMGWREGQGAGPARSGPLHTPDVKNRPALLGLGAKVRPCSVRDDRRRDDRYRENYRPRPRDDRSRYGRWDDRR